MTETLGRFDDSLLPLAEQAMVRKRTDEIKELMRRTAQDLIAVGVRLMEVKALLPHGAFGAWLQSEFDWSERTAQNFMRVAEVFTSETVADLNIQPKALYLLSADRCATAKTFCDSRIPAKRGVFLRGFRHPGRGGLDEPFGSQKTTG